MFLYCEVYTTSLELCVKLILTKVKRLVIYPRSPLSGQQQR